MAPPESPDSQLVDTTRARPGRPGGGAAQRDDAGRPRRRGRRAGRAVRILATIRSVAGGKGSFTGDRSRVLGGAQPENVARALLDDAVDYGRYLIPLVRQELRHRALADAVS